MSCFEWAPGAKRSTFDGTTLPEALPLALPTGTVTAVRAEAHPLAILPGTRWAILVTVSSVGSVFVPMTAQNCRMMAEQLLLASDMLEQQAGGL